MSQALYDIVSNEEMRLEWCEYCGLTRGPFETHHIKPVGSGGPDIRANKINLCVFGGCHTKAQKYEIKTHELVILVARREKATAAAVYTAIGIVIPKNIDEIEVLVTNPQASPKTVEDLLSMLVHTEQTDQEVRFLQGEIVDQLVKRGMNYPQISAAVGKSTAYWRVRHKTYLAFPTKDSRVPTLSWTHHKLAEATGDPKKWIEKAAGKNDQGEETGKEMSVRELRRAIESEAVKKGGVPTEQEEIDRAYRKARRVYNDVVELFSLGGEPATWLAQELKQLLGEMPAQLAKEKKETLRRVK
jgi:hypothetical protein